jgi:PAS domain S-box-containing protein
VELEVGMEWREGMFRELIENSDDINVVVDKDLYIRYVSSSVSDVFDVKPVSLLGRKISEFVSGEHLQQWREQLEQKANFLTDEIEISNALGQKLSFEVRVSNMLHHYPVQGLVLNLNDVTEKRKREQDLIKSNLQLDQVIYKTTHDLKAPLMSALGLVHIAERAPDVEKDRYILLIKKSLMKLNSFIEEMNNFYRVDKMEVQCEEINLGEVLQDELENLQNRGEDPMIRFELEIEEQSEFYSDRVRVRTIVTNILSNAIKYRDQKKESPFVKIVTKVDSRNFDLCIEDNGIGIDPAFHEKIFDLFFRATDQAQGSGLGLFIVKDTIERLAGTIQVKSIVGVGTTFQVRIPNQLHSAQRG